MQHRAAHDEIERARRQFVAPYVRFANRKIRRLDELDQLRIDVDGGDAAGIARLTAEPFGDAAVAGTELEAAPAFAQTQRKQRLPRVRIENFRHQIEPFVFGRSSVVENIPLHHVTGSVSHFGIRACGGGT